MCLSLTIKDSTQPSVLVRGTMVPYGFQTEASCHIQHRWYLEIYLKKQPTRQILIWSTSRDPVRGRISV